MYKIDMHVHTKNVSNCGRIDAKEVAQMYKKAGYDSIVITDHYYESLFSKYDNLTWEEKINCFLSGYQEALEEGNNIGLNVLMGIELRFLDYSDDFLVYGIDREFLYNYKELYKLGLKGFRDLTKNMDILIYQAHPFRKGMTPAVPELIDGVEVYNGNPRHDSNNHLAFEYAEKNQLWMTSGSDFHQEEDLGIGGIIVKNKITSSQELVAYLRNSGIIEIIKKD